MITINHYMYLLNLKLINDYQCTCIIRNNDTCNSIWDGLDSITMMGLTISLPNE